jgi:hypothetical protein
MITHAMFTSIVKLRDFEKAAGHTPYAPPNPDEWRAVVLSQDGRRVRIVLVDAFHPGTGAFTRLIAGIRAAGLTPVIVEPTLALRDWCERHGYRERIVGRGDARHRIWYPR